VIPFPQAAHLGANILQQTNNISLGNCIFLGYYAASSGNFLPTFLNNISVPSSRVKNLDSWLLEPWTWGQQVVPKHWKGITTTYCIITWKNAVLIFFVAEAWV